MEDGWMEAPWGYCCNKTNQDHFLRLINSPQPVIQDKLSFVRPDVV
jgi:hypothetical protein